MTYEDRPPLGRPKVACPYCQDWHSSVVGGEDHPDGYRRTRRCKRCGQLYRTKEVLEASQKIA